MWRTGGGYRGRGGGSTLDRGGGQMGPRRDPNTMDIDGGRGGDRTYYVWGSGATWPKIVRKDIKEE